MPLGDLEALYLELDALGIRAGVAERAKLESVLDRIDDDDEGEVDRLRRVLRAVLAKSPEDARAVDTAYARWARRYAVSTHRPPAPRPQWSSPAPPEPRRRWLRTAIVLTASATLIGLLTWYALPDAPTTQKADLGAAPTRDGGAAADARSGTPSAASRPTKVVFPKTFLGQKPIITVITPMEQAVPLAIIGLLTLALAGLLWIALRRRHLLPEPEPAIRRKGPSVLGPPTRPGEFPQLLDPHDQDTIVWGIGSYTGAEPSRHLDVPRTVKETARSAGALQLHFTHPRHQRGVWLWIDEAARTSSVDEHARELETLLHGAGFAVERAYFWGVPNQLTPERGPSFAPADIEERKDSAMVLVLTDGRLLLSELSHGALSPAYASMLRDLGAWPQLAVVSFGADEEALRHHLDPFDLSVLAPHEVVAFLGQTRATANSSGRVDGADLLLWEACCALPGEPVPATTALKLRKRLNSELGLKLPSWALLQLRQRAGGSRHLRWTPAARAKLLSWLTAISPKERGKDVALDIALRFWSEELELWNDRHLEAERDGIPWRGTPAEVALQVTRSTLDLWREPHVGAAALWQRFQQGDRQTVTAAMSRLSPSDFYPKDEDEPWVPLPWDWRHLALATEGPLTQARLWRIGFAKDLLPPLRVIRPGRLWLTLALLTLFGIAGLARAALHLAAPGDGLTVVHEGPRPTGTWQHVSERPSPGLELSVGARRTTNRASAPLASRVRVVWPPPIRQPCVLKRATSEVWRCGSSDVQRARSTPGRRLVALLAEPSAPDARGLGQALLDTGNADIVIVATTDAALAAELTRWLPAGGGRRHDQLLLIRSNPEEMVPSGALARALEAEKTMTVALVTAADWRALADALYNFVGKRPLRKAWPNATVRKFSGREPALSGHERTLSGRERTLSGRERTLSGRERTLSDRERTLSGRDCVPGQRRVVNGIELVWVCSKGTNDGHLTFTMGSPKSDNGAQDDEQPPHKVAISAFWMGRTEVSNRQYKTVVKTHPKNDDLPVVDVSWHQSRAFCQKKGLVLPTEAEWELAARGTDGRRYPWGNEAPSEQRAVFSNAKLQPIDSMPGGAGPFGTRHQAGNVWEWVADCYEENAYAKRQRRVPRDPLVSCNEPDNSARVVRGGSFGNPVEDLRSALRGVDTPRGYFVGLGFRCARASRRSP